MSRFNGTEQEWRSLFEQWKAALASGDTEREAELWRKMGNSDDMTAILAWVRGLDLGELDAAIAGMEVIAGETRAAVEGLERMLDLGELDALADELGVTA